MNQIQHSGGQTAHTNSTNSVQVVSTASGEANAWSARTSFLPAELVFRLVESIRNLSSISKQLGRRGLGLVHRLVSGAVTAWWSDADGALAYQVSTASAVSELQVVWPWIRLGDLVVLPVGLLPTYDLAGLEQSAERVDSPPKPSEPFPTAHPAPKNSTPQNVLARHSPPREPSQPLPHQQVEDAVDPKPPQVLDQGLKSPI